MRQDNTRNDTRMEAAVNRIAKIVIVALTVATATAAAPRGGEARPGGCLKYGAAGAVAGHVAGHHGVAGAAAGCAVGAWKRHEYNKHAHQTGGY